MVNKLFIIKNNIYYSRTLTNEEFLPNESSKLKLSYKAMLTHKLGSRCQILTSSYVLVACSPIMRNNRRKKLIWSRRMKENILLKGESPKVEIFRRSLIIFSFVSLFEEILLGIIYSSVSRSKVLKILSKSISTECQKTESFPTMCSLVSTKILHKIDFVCKLI